MQLGMIGLGRMGANMARRLIRGGHTCVVYDVDPKAVARLEAEGATASSSPRELVERLASPRALWLMVPAAFVDDTLERFVPLLEAGDVLIDGGNSRYHDDLVRARALLKRGLHYVDVGTSGGVWGAERGYCLMIGGETQIVRRLEPIFATLAPAADAVPRTAGTDGELRGGERGFLHCGPSGAGHFVKMVHNGIEYGLMAAYAEGFDILRHADAGSRERSDDAETTPLEHPEHFQYDLDLPEIAELWRRGSVIGSWLLDLTASALRKDPELSGFAGRVSDSGEGRWTIQAAVEEGVPAHVLTAALYERFSSRGAGQFGNRLLSALRSEFGGHREKAGARRAEEA
jgi:6-phosphogluconate dehydrogenase